MSTYFTCHQILDGEPGPSGLTLCRVSYSRKCFFLQKCLSGWNCFNGSLFFLNLHCTVWWVWIVVLKGGGFLDSDAPELGSLFDRKRVNRSKSTEPEIQICWGVSADFPEIIPEKQICISPLIFTVFVTKNLAEELADFDQFILMPS